MRPDTIFSSCANNVTRFAFFEYFGAGSRVACRIIFSGSLIGKRQAK
jgi:hypothetical protein